jgi:hypothetical protein
MPCLALDQSAARFLLAVKLVWLARPAPAGPTPKFTLPYAKQPVDLDQAISPAVVVIIHSFRTFERKAGTAMRLDPS